MKPWHFKCNPEWISKFGSQMCGSPSGKAHGYLRPQGLHVHMLVTLPAVSKVNCPFPLAQKETKERERQRQTDRQTGQPKIKAKVDPN